MTQRVFEQVDDLFAEKRKEIDKKRQIEADQIVEDLRFVMENPQGRRFLWWLMGLTHIFHCSFTSQSNSTIFNEGERNIGVHLLQQCLKVNPNILEQMINDREKKDV